MASQRQLVEELFEAALALRPGERETFLDKVRGDDPELGRILAELLSEEARVGSFLEHLPFDFLNKIRAVSAAPEAGQLSVGQILLNRFVVVRFIARGGMGEVYEVEDRLLQGVHVALKTILPHIAKIGRAHV